VVVVSEEGATLADSQTGPAGPPATATAAVTATASVGEVSEPSAPVVAEIGPAGGSVVHPAGATLTVPAGVLAGPATVTVRPVPDPRLPVSPETALIPGTGYDVTMVGADGRPILQLARAVTLRLAIPPTERHDGAVLLWVEGETLQPVDRSSLDEEAVSAPLRHFSRFVAGVPDQGDETLGLLTWVVAGSAGLLGLVGRGLFARRRGARARRA